jgi:signal transduction histidine kinase
MTEPAFVPRRKTVVVRVLLSYAVVALAFSFVATWSVIAQRNAARQAEMMRSAYLPLALAIRDAVGGQDTFNSQLNHITTAQNPADKRMWFDTALSLGRPRVFSDVKSTLTNAFMHRESGLEQVGQELLDEANQIERFLDADRELLGKLFDALARRERREAEALRDQLVTRGLQAHRRLRDLEVKVGRNIDGLLAEARGREIWALRVLIASELFTVLAGLLMALYTHRVLKPLAQVTERAQAVAKGDLAPHDPILADDEIGELSKTFESMVSAIARANTELVAAERLATIGKMAAQITHEVRNPLSALALNVELLEEGIVGNTEAQALLSAIKGEVDRLTELSERYLSVARRSKPKLEEEDIGQIIETTLAPLRAELEKHGVRATLTIDGRVGSVLIDEAQIRQVLINLVRNAREAMPEGGALAINVRQTDQKMVEIAFDDDGAGIDAADAEHLFEPFFTTKKQGTGLGLPIAREIVEAHAGRIHCEPRTPKGTRFVIEIPVAT